MGSQNDVEARLWPAFFFIFLTWLLGKIQVSLKQFKRKINVYKCLVILLHSTHRTVQVSWAVRWRIQSVGRAAHPSQIRYSQVSFYSHEGCCFFVSLNFITAEIILRRKYNVKPTYCCWCHFPSLGHLKISTGLTVCISLLAAVLLLILIHRWKTGENSWCFYFHSIAIFSLDNNISSSTCFIPFKCVYVRSVLRPWV